MITFNGSTSRAIAILLGALTFAGTAAADDDHSIYYGSRAGMHLTTVSKSGIGTANAVIVVKHTPKDAKAFCVEYSQDYSMACVKRTMAEVKVADRVTADCKKRTWTDVNRRSYRLEGKQKPSDMAADFAVREIATGDILDGSMASGYPIALSVFQQLCPGIAK